MSRVFEVKWLYSGLATVALAAGGYSWGNYIHQRRKVWTVRLSDAIPVNSRWWKDHQKHQGELLYVAIGDSTSQGIGATQPGLSYVGEVARHIREVTGSTVRVMNLGVSGSTVRGAFIDQLPRLRKLKPDVVTVSIGANNMHDFDVERFENDLQRLFEKLPAHAIVADIPTFFFLPAEKNVRVANVIVHALAKRYGLPVVPLYSYTRRQGLWGIITQFAGDFFHPNDRGYRVWASAFIPAIDVSLHAMLLMASEVSGADSDATRDAPDDSDSRRAT